MKKENRISPWCGSTTVSADLDYGHPPSTGFMPQRAPSWRIVGLRLAYVQRSVNKFIRLISLFVHLLQFDLASMDKPVSSFQGREHRDDGLGCSQAVDSRAHNAPRIARSLTDGIKPFDTRRLSATVAS